MTRVRRAAVAERPRTWRIGDLQTGWRWALAVSLVSVAPVAGLVACGHAYRVHTATHFPVVPGAQVVADEEIQSSITPLYGRYLILRAGPPSTARELVRAERRAVKRAGWTPRHPAGQRGGPVWVTPAPDFVRFGPAYSMRSRVPKRIEALINSTPGRVNQKVAVSMLPPALPD